MKNRMLLIVMIVFHFHFNYGQCPEGDIYLTTQEQIDSFAISFPGCITITSTLYIGNSSSIFSLSPLQNITSIMLI